MSKHKMLQTKSIKIMSPEKEKRWRIFGAWLKSQREAANMSQDGLGDAIGKDRQTIYRIENALSGTTRETVVDLAKALQVSEETALTKAGFASQISKSEIPDEIREALADSPVLKGESPKFVAEIIKLVAQWQNKGETFSGVVIGKQDNSGKMESRRVEEKEKPKLNKKNKQEE